MANNFSLPIAANTLDTFEESIYQGSTRVRTTWYGQRRIASLTRYTRKNWRGTASELAASICNGDILLAVGYGDTAREAYQEAWREYRLRLKEDTGHEEEVAAL